MVQASRLSFQSVNVGISDVESVFLGVHSVFPGVVLKTFGNV